MRYQAERKQSKNLFKKKKKKKKKWLFKENFSAETDKQGYIMSLVCKVCCDSLAQEMKLR